MNASKRINEWYVVNDVFFLFNPACFRLTGSEQLLASRIE